MQLEGKVAIVTGGTKGLGLGIVKQFLYQGATVVCAGRQPYDFQKWSPEFGNRAKFYKVDVRDPELVCAMVNDTIEQFGKVDIMVANAGVIRDNRLIKMTFDDWKEVIDTNLTGVFNCTHAVVEHMTERGFGRIINISSAAATRVNIGQANYCAAKAGVEMFTRVSAMELGPKGILVNCISPGVILEGMAIGLKENEKIWGLYEKRMALRRPGTAEEIGKAALFLVTDESSYVNGHILEVNGGLMWG